MIIKRIINKLVNMVIFSLPIVINSGDIRFIIFGLLGLKLNILLYAIYKYRETFYIYIYIFINYHLIKKKNVECNICLDETYILCSYEKGTTCHICSFICCLKCYVNYYSIKRNCPICKDINEFD